MKGCQNCWVTAGCIPNFKLLGKAPLGRKVAGLKRKKERKKRRRKNAVNSGHYLGSKLSIATLGRTMQATILVILLIML